jgi:2-desacetyl-2-hydroxyethyl bacteriochlorophyllide A dehydrogenase
MKTAFFVGKNKMEFREIPKPLIAEDDVLVKVMAMGVCGTDLQFYKGIRKINFPHISGHEASGEIVEVGSRVKGISVGERVAIDPNINCGHCWYCRRGQFNLCKNKKVLGVSLPGCFSEYVKITQRNILKLPSTVSYAYGSLVEPLSIALHVFNRSNVQIGENVALFGAGTIGLLLLQLLPKIGVNITVIDRVDSKLAKAKSFGADRIVNLSNTSFQSLLKENKIYHKVIDAVGVPETIEKSVELAGPGGRIVWLGLPTVNIKINAFHFLYRELTLYSSLAYNYEFGVALQMIEEGKIDLNPIITNKFKFDELNEALEIQSKGESIKSIILV